jgi:hypothetical protein
MLALLASQCVQENAPPSRSWNEVRVNLLRQRCAHSGDRPS